MKSPATFTAHRIMKRSQKQNRRVRTVQNTSVEMQRNTSPQGKQLSSSVRKLGVYIVKQLQTIARLVQRVKEVSQSKA